MKKTLFLLLTLAISLPLCACGGNEGWEVKQRLDEFGDISESSSVMISTTIEGEYKNVETTSGELVVNINVQQRSSTPHYFFEFELLEDGTRNAVYESIKTASDVPILKTKVGETVSEYYLDAAAPNENLFLSLLDNLNEHDYDGNVLFSQLYEKNDIQCIIYLADSEYHFVIEAANFTKVCEEAEFSAGPLSLADEASEMSVREALEILLFNDTDHMILAQECLKFNYSNKEALDSDRLEEALSSEYLMVSPAETYLEYMTNRGMEVPATSTFNPHSCRPPEWTLAQYGSATQTNLGAFEVSSSGRVFSPFESPKTREIIIENGTYRYDILSLSNIYYQFIEIADGIYLSQAAMPSAEQEYAYVGLMFKCPKNYSSTLSNGSSSDELLTYICDELLPAVK